MPFWQRRFYDFIVWSGRKLREKLEYMHRNPVERKLVGQSKDWPWSSWSHYEKGEKGLIRIDDLHQKEERQGGERKVYPRTLTTQRVRHPR